MELIEEWKLIDGFEKYEISNKGRIRRLYLKGYRYRKPVIQSGYCSVTFSIGLKFKKYQIHRLVALAFIDNKYNKPCVNHIDGNKLNNTSNTRISVDFRVIPISKYQEDPNTGSIYTKMKFAIGDYYSVTK